MFVTQAKSNKGSVEPALGSLKPGQSLRNDSREVDLRLLPVGPRQRAARDAEFDPGSILALRFSPLAFNSGRRFALQTRKHSASFRDLAFNSPVANVLLSIFLPDRSTREHLLDTRSPHWQCCFSRATTFFGAPFHREVSGVLLERLCCSRKARHSQNAQVPVVR